MKKTWISALTLLTSMLTTVAAHAEIPQCWDKTGFETGAYAIIVNTSGTSAKDVAEILFSLQGGPFISEDVGTMSPFKTIEISLQLPKGSDEKVADMYKSDALFYLERTSKLKGVSSIECQKIMKAHPNVGGASLSN